MRLTPESEIGLLRHVQITPPVGQPFKLSVSVQDSEVQVESTGPHKTPVRFGRIKNIGKLESLVKKNLHLLIEGMRINKKSH